MKSRFMAAALAGALFLPSACTGSGYALPSASEAARSFFAAWNEGDARAMANMVGGRAAKWWTNKRIALLLEAEQHLGMIESYSVRAAGRVPQPSPSASPTPGRRITAHAPYVIEYRSRASSAPVELRGRIPLSYDVKEERWRVDFTRGLLWPGVPGAWNFSVASKWPRRASIVDRQGRKLATGPVAHRRYPFGSLAGTTVGHIGVVDGKELARLPGYYGLGDLMGESGLEAAFDRRLGGVPELSLRITGRHGKVVRTLGRSPGRKGRKVTTTLDMRVQAAAAAAYAGHVGGAVVLDPRTGDMLAVVSSSEIDPGNYVGVDGIAPFNRALSGLYPPGSAMKVVTASAGLAAGVVKPSTVLPGPESYKGVTNFESEHFSSITFYDAFVKSVNSVFAQVAERMGVKPMYVYAKRFGFDRKPAMPLEAATPSYPRPKDLGDLMWSAVGQGRDLATPLQMASIAATIANRGVRMEPRIWFGQPKRGRRVISPRIASEIGSMMRSVVLRGTGTAANLPGIPVAGKTGTAEIFYNGGIEDHAWFESFAPYGAPRMASALVVEYGGVGGEVAAPIARSLIERVLPLVR